MARCAAREAVVEVAEEAATGGAGASVPAAAEWDDGGEHDTTGFGCSSTHLLVPVFSRHAGGGDCGASGCVLTEAAVEAAS